MYAYTLWEVEFSQKLSSQFLKLCVTDIPRDKIIQYFGYRSSQSILLIHIDKKGEREGKGVGKGRIWEGGAGDEGHDRIRLEVNAQDKLQCSGSP